MSEAKTPANLRAAPMTYRVERAENLTLQRTVLAQNAGTMTVEEIQAAAAVAQVDLSSAKTKDQMISAVQTQVRGTEPQTED